MTRRFRSALFALASILACLGCVQACRAPPPPSAATLPPVTVLAFGDSGYAYDYLEADDLVPPLSAEQFQAQWREVWLED
jgi:ABC-type glycerol-3-phosphate transport system substrate-binding protein